jgi:hypothetical protein
LRAQCDNAIAHMLLSNPVHVAAPQSGEQEHVKPRALMRAEREFFCYSTTSSRVEGVKPCPLRGFGYFTADDASSATCSLPCCVMQAPIRPARKGAN